MVDPMLTTAKRNPAKSKAASLRKPIVVRKPVAKVPRVVRKSGVGPVRTYRAAMGYLDSLFNYETLPRLRRAHAEFGLTRMNRLLGALGNPHKQLRTVHIAGTKGKGSTAAMLSNMVQANK